MRLLSLLSLSSLLSSAFSLSASQVGSDWQKTLIGVPHVHSPALSPVFHRLALRDGKALVFLLTATTSNVLAGLDPVGGSVAWRHINEDDDPILAFQANQDGIVMLSGPGAANVRLLELMTGSIVWEKQLHLPASGYLMEPQTLGVAVTFAADTSADVFVLANGHSVHRLGGMTGLSKWSWSSPDQTSSVLYTQIVTTPSTVYIVGFVKGIRTYTLHVTSIDAATGAEIGSQSIRSSIADASKNVLALTSGASQQPRLVWTESGNMKTVLLSPDLKLESPNVVAGYYDIVDVQLSSFGHFVGLTQNRTSSIFAMDGTGLGVKRLWELSNSASANTHSESTFGGGLDKEGRPYISRTYWSNNYMACNMELFAPHASRGRGAVTGQTFSFSTMKHGVLLHTAIDVANLSEMRYIARYAITTSTGSLQLWQQDRLLWTREESLADIRASTFVDLPQPLSVGSEPHAASTTEGFMKRLQRQTAELQHLPAYIVRFGKRFASGSYIPTPIADTAIAPWRDAFGFRKFIVVATSFGKIMAIDSTKGEVMWGQLLSISETSGRAQDLKMKIMLTKPSEDPDQKPEIFLAVAAPTAQGGERTHLYHFDALTGIPIGPKKSQGFATAQYELEGSFLETMLVEGSERSVILIDESLDAHVYPTQALQAFRNISSKLHLTLVTGQLGSRRLGGYKIYSEPTTQKRNVFRTQRVWSTSFSGPTDVQAVIKPTPGPVASFGKVLGNRTTLYKYINPHAVTVITSSPSPNSSGRVECGVSVVDGVKGTILYHAPLYTTSGACVVEATLVDNWLVYYHYDDDLETAKKAKGHRITTVGMYEGNKADDKIGSSDLSSFSPEGTKLTVFQQTFVYAHAVKSMAATSTKFGIALKDIVVATEKHQVLVLPRRLLDPRRPNGKPTSEEQEEGLVPFDPVFPDDARRVLSHTHEIARVKHIITSPSQLESTSLVFSYGLDLFQTRVSPSSTFDLLSEDFNRFQLLVTIAGLAIAIAVTKPLVRSNSLKRQWY